MRDRRFVAAHRGGPLSKESHRLLARWAAACAERVLPLFAADHQDDRPLRAIEVAISWSDGSATVGQAQKAAVAAHAAARAAPNPAAVAAARAAGHAAATAHAADHCLGPALYAVKAVAAAGRDPGGEREWQLAQLPPDLRELVVSALCLRVGTAEALFRHHEVAKRTKSKGG
jgi:hypothetical protein